MRIWKTVKWKEEFQADNGRNKPSHQEFKAFYEKVLNHPFSVQLPSNTEDAVMTPVLGDQITVEEVTQEVRNMN